MDFCTVIVLAVFAIEVAYAVIPEHTFTDVLDAVENGQSYSFKAEYFHGYRRKTTNQEMLADILNIPDGHGCMTACHMNNVQHVPSGEEHCNAFDFCPRNCRVASDPVNVPRNDQSRCVLLAAGLHQQEYACETVEHNGNWGHYNVASGVIAHWQRRLGPPGH